MPRHFRFSLVIQRVVFGLSLLIVSQTVHANYPDIVGTFSGTLQGKFLPSGPNTSQTVTIIINNQSGGNFTGSISLSPLNASTTFNGMFLSQTQIDVTCIGSATIAAGPCFAASFNGANLTIPGVGQIGSMVLNLIPPPSVELGGTLGFSGATVVNPEIAPGTSLKDPGTIQSEIQSTVDPVQQHLRKSLHGNANSKELNQNGFLFETEGGLNAGDWQLGNIGVWLSYNYTSIENDFSRTAFESDRHVAVGGVDFSPNDRFIYGVAFSWEVGDTDTLFNNGNLQSDGYTVAPYTGILLSESWSLDASFGLSSIDNDQFRTDPASGARVTSDPDTDRFFFAANLNGITYYDDWVLGARIGMLYARSKTDQFTESNGTQVGERTTKLGQIRVGGDAAYSLGNWEPYVSGLYEYDFQLDEIELTSGLQPANDRDDLYVSTGLRFYGETGISANLEFSKRFLRQEFDEDSFTLTIRYDY